MTRIFAVSQDWPITIKPPPPKTGPGGKRRGELCQKRGNKRVYVLF